MEDDYIKKYLDLVHENQKLIEINLELKNQICQKDNELNNIKSSYVLIDSQTYDKLNFVWYAEHDNLHAVMSLIKRGVDINLTDKKGYTAIIMASENAHFDIVEYLITENAGLNICNDDGWTALIWASKYGHFEIVKHLVQNGANINHKNKYGWTALMNAIIRKHSEVVKYLVENGAYVNIVNNSGYSALIVASYKGQLEIVKCLVENGANINQKGYNNFTGFVKQLEDEGIDAEEYFTKFNINTDNLNDNGITALMFASYNKHFEIVKCLVENGADLNIKSTSIYYSDFSSVSCRISESKIVKYAIERGHEYFINHDGWTALSVAKEQTKNEKIIDYLISVGAKE